MKTSRRTFLISFLGMAVPVIFQALAGTILGVIDSVMVGSISEIAISGVTVANKTYVLYDLIVFGMSSGIGIFLAQYYGANEQKKCRSTFWFGVELACGMGLVFLLLLYLMPTKLIQIYIDDIHIMEIGVCYLKIVKYSYLPEAISRVTAVYFRTCNKPKLPMYASLISIICNIVFNYIFIFGKLGVPEMGVQGAALGTVISKFIEMGIMFYFVIKEPTISLFYKISEKDKINYFHILKKVIPLVLNEGVWALSKNIVFYNYCKVNEDYIPALTINDNIYDIVDAIIFGCAVSAGVIIGEELGAGNFCEAKKTSKQVIKWNVLISISCCALIFAATPFIPSLFSLSGKYATAAIMLLRIKAIFCWTQGYWDTVYYVMRAGGDTQDVFWVDGFFMLCGPMLISTLMVQLTNLPFPYIFLATESTYLMKSIIATYLYKKERWVKNIATS